MFAIFTRGNAGLSQMTRKARDLLQRQLMDGSFRASSVHTLPFTGPPCPSQPQQFAWGSGLDAKRKGGQRARAQGGPMRARNSRPWANRWKWLTFKVNTCSAAPFSAARKSSAS